MGTQPSIALDMLGRLVVQVMWLFNLKHLSMSAVITGSISVNDYRTLANKGVGGVVVKLTEGTTYRNPYAGEQARNAQSAGLQVSAYAFSHYTSEEQARAEARHFISEARNLNLPKNTVMVNDMEVPK